jgi:uncharacterized zinc-type alcohol dehydrogenase-like protein
VPKHQAWIAKGPREPIVLDTLDLGPLGSEDVEVAVDHCGLCHSDLSILNNDRSISSFEAVRDELVGVDVTKEIDNESNQI